MSTSTHVEPREAVYGEPATLLGGANAALVFLVAFFGDKWNLNDAFIAVAMAVIAAGITFVAALRTHDKVMGTGLALFNALVALFGYFSFSLDPVQLSGLLAPLTFLLGLYQRTQTSPVNVGDPLVTPMGPPVVETPPEVTA